MGERRTAQPSTPARRGRARRERRGGFGERGKATRNSERGMNGERQRAGNAGNRYVTPGISKPIKFYVTGIPHRNSRDRTRWGEQQCGVRNAERKRQCRMQNGKQQRQRKRDEMIWHGRERDRRLPPPARMARGGGEHGRARPAVAHRRASRGPPEAVKIHPDSVGIHPRALTACGAGQLPAGVICDNRLTDSGAKANL